MVAFLGLHVLALYNNKGHFFIGDYFGNRFFKL